LIPLEWVDKDNLVELGYVEVSEGIEKGICPCCKKKIDLEKLDDFHKKEYKICGYCVECTDRIIGEILSCKTKGICAKCSYKVDPSSFETEEQLKAFKKYGLCPKCQVKIKKIRK
jgi:hypothetical protein